MSQSWSLHKNTCSFCCCCCCFWCAINNNFTLVIVTQADVNFVLWKCISESKTAIDLHYLSNCCVGEYENKCSASNGIKAMNALANMKCGVISWLNHNLQQLQIMSAIVVEAHPSTCLLAACASVPCDVRRPSDFESFRCHRLPRHRHLRLRSAGSSFPGGELLFP